MTLPGRGSGSPQPAHPSTFDQYATVKLTTPHRAQLT